MQAAGPRALAALTTALARRESILGTFSDTPVPVLLLAGDGDPQLPAIRRTAAHRPAATLIELPGCGHLDTFTRADLTLPLVLPFLATPRRLLSWSRPVSDLLIFGVLPRQAIEPSGGRKAVLTWL
jgi:pimeloyl-ACP methyl ester carboxylesterase